MIARVLAGTEHSRGFAAAKYLGARFGLARVQAVARGAAVALRFSETPHGITFTVFQDGNRNGVRSADIQAGIDHQIEPATNIGEKFAGVDIALSAGTPATNAIQLGQTNLLTFTPDGTATSGTIYLRDRDGTQWAVRVLGATARTRVLRYDTVSMSWHVAH